MGDLVVLPKHWWEGTDAKGNKRDITQPSLEPPLGSGAYKIESFTPGLRHRLDPSDRLLGGRPCRQCRSQQFRPAQIHLHPGRQRRVAGLQKGGLEDIRAENSSRRWATEYNFPALNAGDVIKREFEDSSGQPMQGFALNLRRPQFQDRRVRQALTLAFDFESMNRKLFFGLNTRTDSYFEGQELAVERPADRQGTRNADTLQGQAAAGAFHGGVQAAGLRFAAGRAAVSAGRPSSCSPRPAGRSAAARCSTTRPASSSRSRSSATTRPTRSSRRPMSRACARSASTPRCASSTRANTSTATAISISTASPAIFSQSSSPGNEQRDFWSSKAADTPGSRNLMGIKDPIVDALVERVIFATDRDDLVAATRALDRVLLWNYYVVPQWHRPVIWIGLLEQVRHSRQAAFLYRRRHRFLVDRPGQGGRAGGQIRERQLMDGLSRREFLALGGAALASPLLVGPAFAEHADRHAAAWPVGFRRSQISRRLQAFRLRQSRCAEGRHLQLPAAQLVLQPEHRRPSTR